MLYKSTNAKYSHIFITHLISFVEKYSLFSKNDKLLIAVSGGIDSIVLAYCIVQMRNFGYSNKLRIVHVNHNSRIGQNAEEKFVKDFASSLKIDSVTTTLKGLDPNKNFEYKARLKRYDFFYEIAKPGERIVLAHHIDDSFEWTMLQSLKSSSVEGQIGIPLVNNRVIRPFMCVTKKQILNFASFHDLPFINDPTNELIKYERNFIRNNVIPAFSERYHKYLKHYVYRHNEFARRIGLHLLNKNKSSFTISLEAKSALIYSLSGGSDYSGVEQLVLQGLKHLNPNSRGVVAKQIDNIIKALKNNKFGPLTLTSGVKAYLDFNMILLTKEQAPSLSLLFSDFRTFSFDEYVDFLGEYISNPNTHHAFPFFTIVKRVRLDKRKFDTTFNKQALNELRANSENYYPALKLLRLWSKKSNRHRVLRINLLSQD